MQNEFMPLSIGGRNILVRRSTLNKVKPPYQTGGAMEDLARVNAFEEKQTLYGHSRVVMSVAFSPDGTRLVSGSSDKTVKIWSASRAATDDVRVELPRFNAVIAENKSLNRSLLDLKQQFEKQTAELERLSGKILTEKLSTN